MTTVKKTFLLAFAWLSLGFSPACFVNSEFSQKSQPLVVAVCPPNPSTVQNLTLDFDGNCVTDTAETSSVLIQWFKDQREFGDTSKDDRILVSSQTEKGEVWSAKVYDLDGVLLAETASVTIQNSPPSIQQLKVMPSNPTSSEVVSAVITGEFDPDGDVVRLEYLWQTNTSSMTWSSSEISPSVTTKGQDWTVTVTPFDDEGLAGQSLKLTSPVTIRNSPPTGEISFFPRAPTSIEDVVASVDTSDEDDDETTVTFAWEHPSKETFVGATLAASMTSRGESWTVVAEISDETDTTTLRKSIVIENSLPTVTRLGIEPANPKTTDNLSLMFGLQDGDNETSDLYARVVWEEQTGTNKRYRGRTLTSTWTTRAEEWKVIVTPFDDKGPGVPAEEITVIVNSPPVIIDLTIAPSEPRTQDVLRPTIQASDPDSDEVSFLYRWDELTGTNKTVTNTASLAPSNTLKDEQWQLTVTPKDIRLDGTLISEGQSRTSSSVTVVNTPPTPGVVVAKDAILFAHQASATREPVCDVVSLGMDADEPNEQLFHSLDWYVVETSIPSFVNTTAVTSTGVVETAGYDFVGRGLTNATDLSCRLHTQDQAGEIVTHTAQTNICLKEYVSFYLSNSSSSVGDHVILSEPTVAQAGLLDMDSEGTIETFVFWDGTRGGNLYSRWEQNSNDELEVKIYLNRISAGPFEGYGQAEALVVQAGGREAHMFDNGSPNNRNYSDNSLNRLLEPGTWNHIVLQWRRNPSTSQSDPPRQFQLRVNGGIEAADSSFGGLPQFSSTAGAYLGANVSRGGADQGFGGFDGAVADFRVSSIQRYDWNSYESNWRNFRNFTMDSSTKIFLPLDYKSNFTFPAGWETTGQANLGTQVQPLSFVLESHSPDFFRCLTP